MSDTQIRGIPDTVTMTLNCTLQISNETLLKSINIKSLSDYDTKGEKKVCYPEEMLENGFDLNTRFDKGHTSLMIASEKGSIVVVRYLLNKRCDADIQNESGHSALILTPLAKDRLIRDVITTYFTPRRKI